MYSSNEPIEVLLQNRIFLYSYVSRAFAEAVDCEFADMVRSDHSLKECALLDNEEGSGKELQQKLASHLKNKDLQCDLKAEYEKIMVGPGKTLAYPWESTFVLKEPLLFQKSTLAVREAYLKEGFKAAGYPHEPDDHIAIELSFMAALSQRAMEAFRQGDDERYKSTLLAQAQFLEEHLLRWIGEFSHRLDEVDGISSFYPLFASLATLVCKRDAEVIQELLAAA